MAGISALESQISSLFFYGIARFLRVRNRIAESVLEKFRKALISAASRNGFQVCDAKSTDTYARLTFFHGKALRGLFLHGFVLKLGF